MERSSLNDPRGWPDRTDQGLPRHCIVPTSKALTLATLPTSGMRGRARLARVGLFQMSQIDPLTLDSMLMASPGCEHV